MPVTESQRGPDLVAGTAVGDYVIDTRLGRGGMGTVYAATQPLIHKRVAIKVLHRHMCENARAIERFIQEARAVNRIGHPNIVDVFGFGTTAEGSAFLVMELLVGENLAERAARAPLTLAEVCDALGEITHALEAAHAAGIVHRDLKPDNIFLLARGGVKLLDFGIAKLVGGDGAVTEETRPGVLIGTPRYLSPEQARGLPIDGKADVYALGVVAFELLAGRPPFSGDADVYELIEKHATLTPPRATDFAPGLPDATDALLAGMLAKDAAARPGWSEVRAGFAALKTAPASAHAAARVAAQAAATAVLGDDASATNVETVVAPDARRGARKRVAIAAALAAVVAASAVLISGAGRGGDAEATQAAAAPTLAPASPPAPAPTPAPLPAPAPPEVAADPAPAQPHVHAVHHVKRPARPITPSRAPDDDDGVRSPFQK